MLRFLRFFMLFVLLLAFNPIYAVDFYVGKVGLKAPNLKGYEVITSDIDKEFYTFFLMVTPEVNALKLAYIDVDDYNQYKGGKVDAVQDYKLVQAPKKFESSYVSLEMFKEHKKRFRSQLKPALDRLRLQWPELAKAVSQKTKEYGFKFDIGLNETIPIDMFETDESITVIMLAGYESPTGVVDMINATTIIRVQGKLIFLYSFREYTSLHDISIVTESAIEMKDAYLAIN